jgi:hypothetical protein
MRRSRFSRCLCAVAALAVPLLATDADSADSAAIVGSLGMEPFVVPADPTPAGDLLYENEVLNELNAQIEPTSGWTVTGTSAFEDRQWIAARACRAGGCRTVTLNPVSAVSEPPVVALLAAGLALGLARGKGGFRRPVRCRRG